MKIIKNLSLEKSVVFFFVSVLILLILITYFL